MLLFAVILTLDYVVCCSRFLFAVFALALLRSLFIRFVGIHVFFAHYHAIRQRPTIVTTRSAEGLIITFRLHSSKRLLRLHLIKRDTFGICVTTCTAQRRSASLWRQTPPFLSHQSSLWLRLRPSSHFCHSCHSSQLTSPADAPHPSLLERQPP